MLQIYTSLHTIHISFFSRNKIVASEEIFINLIQLHREDSMSLIKQQNITRYWNKRGILDYGIEKSNK